MWRVCDSNDAYIGMRERTNIAVSNWRVRSGNAGAVGRNTGRPQEDTGSPYLDNISWYLRSDTYLDLSVRT